MAHVGEELRFVLTCYFELPALILDLVEQPRILNRQRRLRRKGLHQVDGILPKYTRSTTADHEHPNVLFGYSEIAPRARKT